MCMQRKWGDCKSGSAFQYSCFSVCLTCLSVVSSYMRRAAHLLILRTCRESQTPSGLIAAHFASKTLASTGLASLFAELIMGTVYSNVPPVCMEIICIDYVKVRGVQKVFAWFEKEIKEVCTGMT